MYEISKYYALSSVKQRFLNLDGRGNIFSSLLLSVKHLPPIRCPPGFQLTAWVPSGPPHRPLGRPSSGPGV